MIELKNVCFDYGLSATITDLSINIEKGEFVAVIGSNGAGKSTLCKLLNGILKPTSGSVLVKGMDTKATKTSTLAKHIGFLFQDPDRQICKNTVEEEILFGLELASHDKEFINRRLNEIIEMFGFEKDASPFQLSRGERQRLALASVLAVSPDILILDEPTTGLDYKECTQIMEIIKTLNDSGVTIIMISHDMEIVLDYAKRVIVLSKGQLAADGNTKDVFLNSGALKEASVLPPQIVRLSVRLGREFDKVFSVDEMLDTIKTLTKVNKRGAVS